jgi:hypothetical protein
MLFIAVKGVMMGPAFDLFFMHVYSRAWDGPPGPLKNELRYFRNAQSYITFGIE